MKHVTQLTSTLILGLALTVVTATGACTKDKKTEPAAKTEPAKAEPAKAEPPKAEPATAPPAAATQAAEPAKTDDKPKDEAKAGGW
jgi:hypothetical protein